MGLQAGETFAGYRVVERIGAGTMGEVVLVENDKLGRREALKVISSGRTDPMLIMRFTNEARLVASLDHPSIVAVYDFGVVDGVPWFTMPFLDTIDLPARAPLAVDRVLRVLADAADALDYAHHRGVIHRDVKPENIAVVEDTDGRILRVAVLDFGVGRLLGATRATVDGQFVGSLVYTAPEVFADGQSGPQSDQYSLACTAFELMTGSLAFEGGSIGEVMQRHTVGEIPVPSDIDPRLARFDEAIARALAKDPTSRFPTCAEFVEALASADLPDSAITTRRTVDRAGVRARPKSNRRRWAIGAVAVIVAAAAGVGGYFAGTASDPPGDSDGPVMQTGQSSTTHDVGDTGGRPVTHRASEYALDGYRFAFRTEDGGFACYFADEPMCFPKDPTDVAWTLVDRCSAADRGTPTHLVIKRGRTDACAAVAVVGRQTPRYQDRHWQPTPRILESTHSVFVDTDDGRWVCQADAPGGGPQDDPESDAIMSFAPVWCSRESSTTGRTGAPSFGFDREDNGLIIPRG
ncbi:Serine/threonine protein kinase [Gordonia malaquae]|uniref:non-specific serine/threonine protein kinase n=1 Tax=Gordonia malaquae NBRC 108250 TaxID=1223542 RepID=M3VEH3_GORML|nr:serine/threonine-protein kinase [Gordonia malaquae]GAC79244.1 hypothetical protein GM1_008_00060 [Gordonia malaquae NBRC 108250]SEE36918.1 Serine/threonine protein kinase [Gordonia malaquae]